MKGFVMCLFSRQVHELVLGDTGGTIHISVVDDSYLGFT